MTGFTGPLVVKRLDSDTTAAVVDAAGSATFDGLTNTGPSTLNSALTVNAPTSLAGTFVAGSAATLNANTSIAGTFVVGSAATFDGVNSAAGRFTFGSAAAFSGSVSAKKDVDVSGAITSDIGKVALAQSVTISAMNTAAVTAANILPGGAVHDFILLNRGQMFGTAQATVNILVGSTANDNYFGQFTNVSAQSGSIHTIGNVCGVNMARIGAAQHVVVKTTITSGAFNAGQGEALIVTRYTR